MNEIEQLKKQIDELKSTVDSLKAGETKIITMSSRIQTKRREIFDKYFGKWASAERHPVGNNKDARWADRNELMEGLKRLASVTYKTVHGAGSSNINGAIKNDSDLEEYASFYEFYCANVSMQIMTASEALNRN